MTKRINFMLFMTLIIFSLIYSKAIPPKPGTIKSYSSSNKIYSVEIEFLNYPDNSPCNCTFKKDNKIEWKKQIPSTPGIINIADNGNYFACANWGWYDEGGFKSLTFYDGSGELLKKFEFGPGKDRLRWIRKTAISADGNYFISSYSESNVSSFSLFNIPKNTLKWDKKIGLEQIDSLIISRNCKYLLFSTFDYQKHNIRFSYLNIEGDILWESEIENGHAWNNLFMSMNDDGLEFKIYNKNTDSWILYVNKNGDVKQVLNGQKSSSNKSPNNLSQ